MAKIKLLSLWVLWGVFPTVFASTACEDVDNPTPPGSGNSGKAVLWTKVANNPLGGGSIHDVARGDTYFVAVSGNDIAYSEKGFSWTKLATGLSGGWVYEGLPNTFEGYSIAYGNGVFVMMDFYGAAAYANENALSTWTKAPRVGADSQPFSGQTVGTHLGVSGFNIGVRFCNNLFIAHQNGKIKYSADKGLSWNDALWTGGGSPFKIISNMVCSKSGVVAVGSSTSLKSKGSGRVAYSDDGRTWSELKGHPFVGFIPALVWNGDMFIAFENAYDDETSQWSARVAVSRNGTVWEVVNEHAGSIPPGAWYLGLGGGQYVSGYGHVMRYSDDGIVWGGEYELEDSNGFYSLAYGDKRFVGVGLGVLAYSEDME
ncbi:MAG: hypothetical protein FWD46_05575 [Cystobacterineae bacterium]|nr:hypothetical protein [Cystobacterineae bacterium]